VKLLFWKRLSKHLVEKMGFKVNKYNYCVVNKMINGKQCTILWHVDNLKISHVSDDVLTDVINTITRLLFVDTPSRLAH